MLVSPLVDVEVLLIHLICDAVLDFTTDHHLFAAHEVHHNIFEYWDASYRVYGVEVYFLVSADLETAVGNCSVYIIQTTLQWQ